MMKLYKRIARTVAVLVLSVATIFGCAVSAQAATWSVCGTTNTGGYEVNYNVYRQHAAYGNITISVSNGVTNGARFTMQSIQGNRVSWSGYFVTGSKTWTGVLSSYYTIVAQQGSCSVWQKLVTGCDNYWAGSLTM